MVKRGKKKKRREVGLDFLFVFKFNSKIIYFIFNIYFFFFFFCFFFPGVFLYFFIIFSVKFFLLAYSSCFLFLPFLLFFLSQFNHSRILIQLPTKFSQSSSSSSLSNSHLISSDNQNEKTICFVFRAFPSCPRALAPLRCHQWWRNKKRKKESSLVIGLLVCLADMWVD